MKTKDFTRRKFVGTVSAGTLGAVTIGSIPTFGAAKKSSKLAILGGEPVRKNKSWPDWPYVDKNVLDSIEKTTQSGIWCRIQSKDGTVPTFEKKYAEMLGVGRCVAVGSGTQALHTAVEALGLGPGDEVITSPYTDPGTIAAILSARALPVLADIDRYSFQVNPDDAERRINKNTKAIMPVHMMGQPADMDRFLQIARKHNLFLIEDACQEIANCNELDVIIISSPDYFHPQHLEAVVDAGKHCYCEKPAAVDVAGCRKFIELGKRAEGKLSLDVGFQVRSAPCFSEVVKRIHNGDIGTVSFGALHYHASGIGYPAFPNASPLERKIRQFYWDNILSGDTIVDQHIHMIDIANWVMDAHPVSAMGYGSRKVRNDAGNVFDNWAISLKYPDGVNMSLSAVQYANFWDVGARFIGDRGTGESNYSGFAKITGDQAWSSVSAEGQGDFSTAGTFNGLGDANGIKTGLFIDSIVSGNYHNQAREGAESALSAILARTAAYSGEEIKWSEMMGSNQSYDGYIDLADL